MNLIECIAQLASSPAPDAPGVLITDRPEQGIKEKSKGFPYAIYQTFTGRQIGISSCETCDETWKRRIQMRFYQCPVVDFKARPTRNRTPKSDIEGLIKQIEIKIKVLNDPRCMTFKDADGNVICYPYELPDEATCGSPLSKLEVLPFELEPLGWNTEEGGLWTTTIALEETYVKRYY